MKKDSIKHITITLVALISASQSVYIPCRIVKDYNVYSLDVLNRNTFTTQLNNTVPENPKEKAAINEEGLESTKIDKQPLLKASIGIE